jgi:hypothetical protein
MIVRWFAALAASAFVIGCLFFVGTAGPTLYARLSRYFRPAAVWALVLILMSALAWFLAR